MKIQFITGSVEAKDIDKLGLDLKNKIASESDFRKKIRELNLKETQKQIAESVGKEQNIMLAIQTYDSIVQNLNALMKKFVEWYSLYFPEAVKEFNDYEKLIHVVLDKKREDVRNDLKFFADINMGGKLDEDDFKIVNLYLTKIKELYDYHEKLVDYIDNSMKKVAPNVESVAGGLIGARLMYSARGLKGLMMSPASKIQLYGAEKALFRHLKTGSRSPKYGVLFAHPLVQSCPAKNRGKMARTIADKLSLAAKIDYFKGEFRGELMNKELQEKLNLLKETKQ